MDAPSVFVEGRIGTVTYPRCEATQLPNGDLMVNSIDTGDVIGVHPAGTWRVADCNGEFFRATVPMFPFRPLIKKASAA
jgi:hypothetical protein